MTNRTPFNKSDSTGIAKKADIVISKILKHIEEDGCACCREAMQSD
jgi:hypothetical protein